MVEGTFKIKILDEDSLLTRQCQNTRQNKCQNTAVTTAKKEKGLVWLLSKEILLSRKVITYSVIEMLHLTDSEIYCHLFLPLPFSHFSPKKMR